MNAVTLYTLPSLVLVISLIAIVIASLSIHDSKTLSTHVNIAGQPLTSIASTNGFSSQNENNEAVLTTSIADGLLFGNNGILTTATDTDITSTLLTGFVMDQSGTPILSTNSLLQGFQKCTQLNGTPLSGLQLNTPGAVTPNDTVFSGLQTLASSVPLITPYIFLSTGLATVTNATGSLWPIPYFGATSLQLQLGTTFLFETWGTTSNASGVTKSLNVNFIFNNQTLTLTTPWTTSSTNILIQTYGVTSTNTILLLHRLIGTSGSTTLGLSSQQIITLPSDNLLPFSMTATTTGLTITTQGGSGSCLFR